VVKGFEYASDPDSYNSGRVATGRAHLAGQVKGVGVYEERPCRSRGNEAAAQPLDVTCVVVVTPGNIPLTGNLQ